MAGVRGPVAFLTLAEFLAQATSMTRYFKRVLRRFRDLTDGHDVRRLGRYAIVAGGAALAVVFTGSYAPSGIARGAPSILFLVLVLSFWYGGLRPAVLAPFICAGRS